MDPRDPDRLAELVDRHPRLFRGQIPARSHLSPGWFDLVDRLCFDLEALCADDLPLRVVQVKEKFGTLRVYVRPSAEGVSTTLLARAQALCQSAEEQSESLCEGCGAPSALHQSALRWWNTLCARCTERKEGDRE